MKKSKISIISPVYQVENILRELKSRISNVTDNVTMTYERVLVDDRSSYGSRKVILELI